MKSLNTCEEEMETQEEGPPDNRVVLRISASQAVGDLECNYLLEQLADTQAEMSLPKYPLVLSHVAMC